MVKITSNKCIHCSISLSIYMYHHLYIISKVSSKET